MYIELFLRPQFQQLEPIMENSVSPQPKTSPLHQIQNPPKNSIEL